MQARINWFGFAGGVTVVLLIAVSIFVPWWQLIVGDSLVEANVSPIYTNFDLLDNAFTIPLLLALNVSCIILMAAGGVAILIYSIKPGASYSNRLLGFGYRKPLYSLILFVVGLVAIVLIVKSVLGLEVPLIGSGNTMLPPEMTQGATVSVLMTAGFQWPFLLAIVATALCIAARFYHKSAVPSQKTAGTDIPPSPPASTTTT